jgi:SAM-dependent methyltransferase
MRHDAILTAVERYYSGKFAEHGPSAQGVDWNSADSQQLRFEQLAVLLRHERARFSVNDLGCGYGALAAFLGDRGYAASYTGYDLSSAMLEHARTRFHDRADIGFRAGTRLDQADYSLASGVFNVKLSFDEEDWHSYVDETIAELARSSRKGFAFNMLTSYSDADRRRPDLYYADPGLVFHMCKTRYSRDVALLHDYGLWEFTIIVRLSQ